MRALFSLILLSLLTFNVNASVLPDNDMYIPVSTDKSMLSITKDMFDKVLDRIEDLYTPIFKDNQGATLQVIRRWEDGTVNAYAEQNGMIWKITMFGGLARHEAITEDGFALVACHELGHHIAGAPKIIKWGRESWAYNEGQSDLFATSKCFRKYVEEDDNIEIMQNVTVPSSVRAECRRQFLTREKRAICRRGAMAGLSLATLLNSFNSGAKKVDFETPDKTVVNKTNHLHPAAQCRLDTYLAGAVCDRDAYDEVDAKDPNIGYCNRRDGDKAGVRPLCWYKPVE